MPEINAQKSDFSGKFARVTWANAKAGDTFKASDLGILADRSIQVYGTFSGATVNVLGRNSPDAPFMPLNDPHQNPLAFTAAKIESVLEVSWEIKPEITGGDANTDLTIVMIARKG